MERKEFLSLIGLGSASALAAVCMGSCSKSTESTTTPGQPTTPTNVNITLDLTLPANAALANPGGYIYTGAIIVAKTIAGNFIAVSKVCTQYNFSIFWIVNSASGEEKDPEFIVLFNSLVCCSSYAST